MPTNYLYIRTSTKEQRYGLETQRQFLNDNILLEHKDNKIVEVVEQLSGKELETRKLNSLLDSLSEGDVIYAYDISRLTRSEDTNAMINAITKRVFSKKAQLIIGLQKIDPNNYEQELSLLIGNAIAIYYRKVQNAKARAGIKVKKSKGEWIFKGSLYGYEVIRDSNGAKVIIKEDEADIIRYIYNEYIKGRSINEIHIELKNKGLKKGDSEWHQAYVRRILNNPIYAGMYYAHKEQKFQNNNIDDLVESKYYQPIIDIETFLQAQKSYKYVQRKHAKQFAYRYSAYELAGIIKCGYCLDLGQRSTYVHSYKKRETKTYSLYVNRVHHKECVQEINTMNEEVLNTLFRISFYVFVSAHAEIASYFENLNEENKNIQKVVVFKINEKKRELDENKKIIEDIADKILNVNKGLMDVLMRKSDEAYNKIQELEKEILLLESESADLDFDTDYWDHVDERIDILIHHYEESRREVYKKYINNAYIKDGLLIIEFINKKKIHIGISKLKGRRFQKYFNFKVFLDDRFQYGIIYDKDNNKVIFDESFINVNDRFNMAMQYRLYELFIKAYSYERL